MKLRQRGAVEDQNQRNLGKLPKIPKVYNCGVEPDFKDEVKTLKLEMKLRHEEPLSLDRTVIVLRKETPSCAGDNETEGSTGGV